MTLCGFLRQEKWQANEKAARNTKRKLIKKSCHNFLIWTGIMKAVKSSGSNFSDHVTWVSFRPILLIDTLLIWHSFARNIPTLVVPSTIIIHISCQFIFLFPKAPPPPQKKNKDIRIYKDNKSNTHTHTQTPFFLDGTLNCYHPSTLASQTKRTPPKSNGRQPSVGGTVEVPISEYHPWTPRGCHLRYLLNLLKIFQITFKLVKHQQTLTTHQTLKHWLRSNYSDCSSHWFLPVTADIEDGGMGSPPIERW